MTREDKLAELLERWEAAAASGSAVTPAEVCSENPTLLPEFTELLHQLAPVTALMKGQGRPAIEELVGHLNTGRYTPVSFHAQGGLGVIFLADDQELHRPVALKRLQSLHASDSAARRKFLAEAEITGKLEHPGVVPVYGVGTDSDGQPYYAMRFIHGATLKDAAQSLHESKPADDPEWNLEFRRLLRSFVSVCQTMAYAHSRGVIHRDLKPANVMLGRYGETLVVDWGLAKPLDRNPIDAPQEKGFEPICVEADAEGNTIGGGDTVDGEFKGSPAFMAPEQARGEWDRVGPAADIYSLGATLYVLLTGRKPFAGSNMTQVLDDVKRGRFTPVQAANSAAPRPLEAICRKAMALEPDQRYASARDLADDVERWLADEPVTAWREPFSVRARRWAKRHRMWVAAGVAVLIAAVLLSTVAGGILGAKNRQLHRLNYELAVKNGELRELNDELGVKNVELRALNDELAQKNVALRKLNEQLTQSYAGSRTEYEQSDVALRRIMENSLVRTPSGAVVQTDAVRLGIYRMYGDHLVRFIERNRAKPELQVEVATSHLKLGELHILLGEKSRGLKAYEAAERLFQQLLAAAPNDRDVQFGYACAVGDRGLILVETGQFAVGKPMVISARQLFEELARNPEPVRLARFTSDTTNDVYRDSPALRLARLTHVLVTDLREVNVLSRIGFPGADPAPPRTEEERRWLDSALKAVKGRRDLPMDAPVFTHFFALQLELANLEAEKPSVEKRRRLQAVADRLSALMKLHPAVQELRSFLVEASVQLAGCAESDADLKAAEKHLLDALYHSRQLANALEGHDPFAMRGAAVVTIAEVWEKIALLAARRNQPALFDSYLDACLRVGDEYAGLKRHLPAETVRILLLYLRIALEATLPSHMRPLAEKFYAKSRDLSEMQLKETPGESVFEICDLISSVAAAAMHAARGQPLGDMLKNAEKIYQKLIAETPNDPYLAYQRASMLSAQASEAALSKKDWRQAISIIETALKELDAAAKSGSADELVFARIGPEIQLVAMLGGLAEDLLAAKPQGDPEALQLVQRALKLAREQKKRQLPADSAGMDKFVQYLRSRLERYMPELEKLERRAMGKK